MDAAEAGISRSAPIRSEPVQVDKSRSFDVTALAAAAGRARSPYLILAASRRQSAVEPIDNGSSPDWGQLMAPLTI